MALLEDDILYPHRVLPRQLCQWVHATWRAAVELQTRVDEYVSAVFWTRLYGLLGEGLEWLAEDREWVSTGSNEALLQVTDALLDSLRALKAQLTEDELIYVQFRRHTEGHPFQDRIRIQMGKRGVIQDTVFGTLAGRKVPIQEVRAIVQRIDASTRGQDSAVAVATSILPALQAVEFHVTGYELARPS